MIAQQYKLVGGYTTLELEKEVNEAIKDGWQPLGGVFALPFKVYGRPWCQAMVRFAVAEEGAT
jgi:hypothetical protein